MSLLLADLALRGGVLTLLLLVAALLLREHAEATVAQLGAAFAVSACAYVVCSAPVASHSPSGWELPLLVLSGASSVLLWLLASALFEDNFQLQRWHGLLWLGMAALTLINCLTLAGSSVLGRALAGTQLLAMLVFAVLALLRALATWRADLLEARRRLRLVVIAGASLHLLVSNLIRLTPSAAAHESVWSAVNAAALFLIASAIVWLLLRTDIDALLPKVQTAHSSVSTVDEVYASPALIAEVQRAMNRDQLFRDGDLTIGALAAKLGLLEYKLRRIINQGLGYRNFNAFLNHYRVEWAKAALSETHRADDSILSVAMDCGFQSLGPFNRAFKAHTGMTPTEFRRSRPAHSKIG